jgi:hypothetical protein
LLRLAYIRLLRRLVAAGQQYHQRVATHRVIHPVTGADVQPQLGHATVQIAVVPGLAGNQTLDPGLDTRPARGIA